MKSSGLKPFHNKWRKNHEKESILKLITFMESNKMIFSLLWFSQKYIICKTETLTESSLAKSRKYQKIIIKRVKIVVKTNRLEKVYINIT